MGVIKIETFDVDVATAASTTHTLTNDVGSLNSAFVRRTTSIDKQSGRTDSTGNLNPNDACSAAFLSATNTVSFRQNNTNPQKLVGEVWRYTGAASGADEFIVRGRYTVTLAAASTTGSTATSGIVNVDDCVPVWTGATSDAVSVNDYDSSTVSVFIDASGNIQCQRGASTGTLVIYVTVVEFTGVNWSVGHGVSTSHDAAAQTITLNTASIGTGGSTFDVGNWENAMFLDASLEGDTVETGLSDNLGVWSPGTTTQASFTHLQDGASRNDGAAYCHVIKHVGLRVYRDSDIDIAEGNGTYANITSFPVGTSLTETIDELSLEWFSDTSGTGTAHARGRLSAYINDPTGNITFWVHRSGNNVRADWGVVQLGLLTGVIPLSVYDVDTDEILTNTQLNVVITGASLGAVQGTGSVRLTQFSNGTGTSVLQTVDSWSDTSIQFDVTAGGLADTLAYVYVTSDAAAEGSIAVQIGLPPETYTEAILAMATGPSHYWRFQNTYVDEVGSATADNGSGGTPTFDATNQIVKGDTHSFLTNSETDFISPADQTDMNTGSLARRHIGGWFMLDRVSQTLSVIYEEGAQVNNMALLNGFGNNAVFQIANAADDYIQLYMDIALTPNRPYLFLAEFNASGFKGGVCTAFLDGVAQSRSNGNPWETAQLDSHSGNISFGHETSEALKVGDDRGVDATTITFVSPVNCNYAHWFNWSNATLDWASDIRVTLFEKGAPAAVTISADTQVNMQTALDAYADTVRPDWPCAIEIAACTDGDFALDLDNISFSSRCSIDIRYVGADTLTMTLINGSSVDPNKTSTPYGGTISIVSPVLVTVSARTAASGAVVTGAYVLLEADTGGGLTAGVDIIKGLVDGSGNISTNFIYTADQPVVGIVRQGTSLTYYKTAAITGTITSSGLTLTAFMVADE